MTPFEQMRAPDATRASLVAAIAVLQPDHVQWWQYNVSHQHFMLRLYRTAPSDYLMIATFGTRHLSGPTGWSHPNLIFDVETDLDRTPETVWAVQDAQVEFSMECTNLYWGRDVGWDDRSGWFSAFADPNGT